VVLASRASSSVSTAIDGAGNAIAVFGSSYSWHLAGGSWGAATPLPAGSSGGLVAADPAGSFVYADSSGNAFTFRPHGRNHAGMGEFVIWLRDVGPWQAVLAGLRWRCRAGAADLGEQ